jgi:hypothetical protein
MRTGSRSARLVIVLVAAGAACSDEHFYGGGLVCSTSTIEASLETRSGLGLACQLRLEHGGAVMSYEFAPTPLADAGVVDASAVDGGGSGGCVVLGGVAPTSCSREMPGAGAQWFTVWFSGAAATSAVQELGLTKDDNYAFTATVVCGGNTVASWRLSLCATAV